MVLTQFFSSLWSNCIFFPVNSNENMVTRIQEMSMDYHFKVEQESGSTMFKLFGFNGKQSFPATFELKTLFLILGLRS